MSGPTLVPPSEGRARGRLATGYLAAAVGCFLVGAALLAISTSEQALAMSEGMLLGVALFVTAALLEAYRNRGRKHR